MLGLLREPQSGLPSATSSDWNLANHRKLTLVYLALTGSAFFWGSGFVAIRFGLRSVSPIELIAGQGLFAAAAQIGWCLARGRFRKLQLPRELFWPVVALGLVGHPLLNALTCFGLASTTATNAALIYGFSPVMIGILAALFLRETLSATKLIGAAVGFGGVALIITQGELGALRFQGMMVGNLLIFGGALYWAAYSVATRRLTQRVPPEVYTFYILALGAVGPTVWAWRIEHRFPLFGHASAELLTMAFLGLGTGTLAQNFWSWGLEQIEASRVGVFSYLEPVFATTVAMIFLGERLTLPTVFGAALVFAGIFLSTQSRLQLAATVRKPSGPNRFSRPG